MHGLEVLIGFALLLLIGLPVVTLILALVNRSSRKDLELKFARLVERFERQAEESSKHHHSQFTVPASLLPWNVTPRSAGLGDSVDKPVQSEAGPEAIVQEGPWDRAARQAEAAETGTQSTDEDLEPEKPNLEEAIGGRWSVILGGIAIALGAIFLVRYSIEAGLLGPAARVTLGTLLTAVLLAGGEWLRRRDKAMSLPVIANADIPGILTGAGAVAAFATLYSAHALYGFVGPALAFVGLTLIGLATVLLASVHGPKLAAVGILGAYGAPILVSSSEPNPIALTLHVLVVTATVMATARLRQWLWLARAGLAGSIGWTILMAAAGGTNAGLAGALLVTGLALIYTAVFAWDIADRPQPLRDRPVEREGVLAFSALTLAFVFHLAFNIQFPEVFAGLSAALVMTGVAVVWPGLSPVAIAAAVTACMAVGAIALDWQELPGLQQWKDVRAGLLPPDIGSYLLEAAIITIPPAALAAFVSVRSAASAPRMAGWLAAGASGTAFFAVVLAYLRIAPFETRPVFGAVSLGLAAIFATLMEKAHRQRPDDWYAPAPAAFMIAAIAFSAFGIAVSMTKGWLPVAFAGASLGISWSFRWRPLAVVPWLSLVAGVIGAYALWRNAPFPALEIGKTPFFNGLIILAGLPALLLVVAGENLRRLGSILPGGLVSALGLAALGLFVGLELRHFLHDGEIVNARFQLDDMAAQTIAALSFAVGLQRIASRTGARVYDYAALAAGAISIVMIAAGLLVFYNPYFNADAVVGEGRVFNLLLPAYLVTGLLAAIVAWLARPVRPRWYTLGYAAISGMLLFTYASGMVRHAFQGTSLVWFHPTSDLELWTYSAVWLLLGAALLIGGLFARSQPLRVASGILIALTVCKVFLVDMSALTGPLRAFSFIGLGLSLVAIGRLYQRLLFRKSIPADRVS